MSSHAELWAAQVREWPNSVELTVHEMYKWCDEPLLKRGDHHEQSRRYQHISMLLQYESFVFYITNPDNGYIGARHGVEGHEYLSGFGSGHRFRFNDKGELETAP